MVDYSIAAAAPAEFRIGGVLSQAFSVIRRAPGPVIGLSLIGSLPSLFVLLSPSGPADRARAEFLMLLPTLFLNFLLQAAFVYGAFRQLQGESFTMVDSVVKGLRRIFPLLVAGLLTSLALILGLFLLVVPGLLVYVMYYVVAPACVVERLGPITSMRRSAELTKGFRWKIFGLALLVLVVTVAAGFLVGFVLAAARQPFAGAVATYAIDVATTAFGSIVVAIAYYQLRAIKEGLSLDKVASVFD